jgi:hypothetical protein
MVSLRGNKSEMESNNKCDEVPRGGHSGNPKKSGRVFRVLRNSGSENHNPRNARKNNNPKFGYPRFSGSGSGNPELPDFKIQKAISKSKKISQQVLKQRDMNTQFSNQLAVLYVYSNNLTQPRGEVPSMNLTGQSICQSMHACWLLPIR